MRESKENVIDARGLTCPAPVLKTKEHIEKERPQTLSILVDNQAARENVNRFLGSQGYAVDDNVESDNFRLIGTVKNAVTSLQEERSAETAKIVVLIMTDKIGRGDDELGASLMVNYIKTLQELGDDLWQLIFVNGGVRLACADSPVIAELQSYEAAGTVILSCGTCMEHFGLTTEKAVGGLTNMLDIVMAQQNADKVITLS